MYECHDVAGNIAGSIFTNMYLLASLNPLSIFSVCLLRLGRKAVLVVSYLILLIFMTVLVIITSTKGGRKVGSRA